MKISMKTIQKFFLSVILLFTVGISPLFAAEINFSTTKTSGTTDDVFQIHLSVNGQVDGGQVGIKGLENFDIVGRQSSSQVQIINGKTKAVQEQILSIRPKKGGKFTLQAIAKEDGKLIESQEITFDIQKSLIQSTKEKLLQASSNQENSRKNSQEDLKNKLENNEDKLDEKKDEKLENTKKIF